MAHIHHRHQHLRCLKHTDQLFLQINFYMTHFLVLILRKRIKRKLTFSFATDFVPNSGYLSDCDLSTTKIIISNLEKTINQEIKEYEWGGGQGRI